MRPVNPSFLHDIEEKARSIGRVIGQSLSEDQGFALMLFSYTGPELTWISNARREDMIVALEEFIVKLKSGTADTLSRPKGKG